MKRDPQIISPRQVLEKVATAIPAEVHGNIIIIGSLAAAYWLFKGDNSFGVRTKDNPSVILRRSPAKFSRTLRTN